MNLDQDPDGNADGSQMALTLYTNPLSRGRIARWMLEETGQDYQTRILEYDGAMQRPDFLAINPMGKVPTIVHDGVVVTEAAAVCAYLADAFPDAGLAPPPQRRGDYYRWLFFAAGPLEASVTNASLGWTAPEDKHSMVGYGTLERVLGTLDETLSSRDYLCDNFSAADVYLGAQLGYGMQFGSIEARPAFERYWQRLSCRAAWRTATALDDSLSTSR